MVKRIGCWVALVAFVLVASGCRGKARHTYKEEGDITIEFVLESPEEGV
jgi:hypothetical protein